MFKPADSTDLSRTRPVQTSCSRRAATRPARIVYWDHAESLENWEEETAYREALIEVAEFRRHAGVRT